MVFLGIEHDLDKIELFKGEKIKIMSEDVKFEPFHEWAVKYLIDLYKNEPPFRHGTGNQDYFIFLGKVEAVSGLLVVSTPSDKIEWVIETISSKIKIDAFTDTTLYLAISKLRCRKKTETSKKVEHKKFKGNATHLPHSF